MMNVSFYKIAFTLLAFICLIGLAPGQSTDGEIPQQDFLNGHNKARNQVGVANLTWNPTIEAAAAELAKLISDFKGNVPDRPDIIYGENVFTQTNVEQHPLKLAISAWYSEITNYNYTSNSCIDGGVACKSYTQMVWNQTFQLGCAYHPIDSPSPVVVCCYYPRGNVEGQRPY